ncbi:alpha/beta hydrolase [Filobacillus milosensis]|nr:alpha/beta hydrolase [Filobacillus milosensis]
MWRKKVLENGHQLFLHETPGNKGTIIAVHGLLGHHMQLGHYQRAFENQYRMITYDLRGRGKSTNASFDTCINRHVEDLVYLIYALKIKSPILLGYSTGAYICLKAAALIDGVSAVILLDGAAQTDEGQKELILPSIVRLKNVYPSRLSYIEESRVNYEKLGIRWSEHMNRFVNYEIEKKGNYWTQRSNPNLIEQDFLSSFEYNIENIAPKINVPVMLIHAEGNVGNRPFYYESQFNKLKELIKDIQIVKSKANHFSLVFNRQIELEWKMLKFLNESKEKVNVSSSTNKK